MGPQLYLKQLVAQTVGVGDIEEIDRCAGRNFCGQKFGVGGLSGNDYRLPLGQPIGILLYPVIAKEAAQTDHHKSQRDK